jgi:hypothetical protein
METVCAQRSQHVSTGQPGNANIDHYLPLRVPRFPWTALHGRSFLEHRRRAGKVGSKRPVLTRWRGGAEQSTLGPP